jgi:response regulator RpfG family c-di-GMP phosphodiesterase
MSVRPEKIRGAMLDRCKKLEADGRICMTSDAHLMTCLTDVLTNKIWPSLEFMKMARAGDIEMSNEVADLVIRNLEDISSWIDFLKEKRACESAKKRMLPTERSRTIGLSGELALSLATEKVASRDFLQRLASLAEFRDSGSGNHILRVGLYANKVSEMLDLPMTFIDKITFASTLHDIGKMGIPAAILFKEPPLTEEESSMLKEHTTIGQRLLGNSPSPLLQMAAEIALTHHENWDGTGYPQGLRAKQIPLAGAIVKVCDVYDTLRSRHFFKKPMSHEQAIHALQHGNDLIQPAHFHPDVLDAFLEIAPVISDIFDAHHRILRTRKKKPAKDV